MNHESRWAQTWIRFAHQRPWMILGVAFAFTILMGVAASRIQIRGDFAALLPPSFPSVQGFEQVTEKVGGLGFFMVAVEGNDPKQVSKMVKALAKAIEPQTQLFRSVQIYKLDPFIQKRALYLLDQADLKELHKRLTRLRDEMKSEVRRNNPLAVDLDDTPKSKKRPQIQIDDLLKRYNLSRDDLASEGLIASRDGKLAVILAQPNGVESDLALTRKMLAFLNKTKAAIQKNDPALASLTVRYSGRYTVRLEEDESTKQQVSLSSGISLLGILLLLVFYTRQKRSILLIGLPLVLGVIWTAGIVFFLTNGEINLMTAFIIAVLLGLGIDMGIHFFMHFLHLRRQEIEVEEALVTTLSSTGKAGSIAVLTSSAAFLVIMFTDFKGLSQFGMVTGLGLLVTLFAFFTIFPVLALLTARHIPIKPHQPNRKTKAPIPPPRMWAWSVGLAFGIVLAIWGSTILITGNIRFDDDVWNLVTQGPSVKTYNRLKKEVFFGEAEPGILLFPSWDALKTTQERLEAEMKAGQWKTVRSIQSQLSLVPKDAEAKQPLLQSMATLLDDKAFRSLDEDEHAKEIALLKAMQKMTRAKPYSLNDIPLSVKKAMGGGQPLLFIIPAINPTQANKAITYANEIRAIHAKHGEGRVIVGDSNIILADMFILLGRDGPRAVLMAFGVILLILLFGFRSKLSAVPLVLMPLCTGLLMLLGMMWVFDLRLNAFNFMALPVTLGLGIDHSVYIYHRWDEDGRGSILESLRSVLPAILLAATTSMIGFGSLIPLMHPGLSGLGSLTVLGIACGLLTALLVMPSLLALVRVLYANIAARKYKGGLDDHDDPTDEQATTNPKKLSSANHQENQQPRKALSPDALAAPFESTPRGEKGTASARKTADMDPSLSST